MAEAKRTVKPSRTASRPRPTAKCVLPTPGGPSSSKASPLAIQRQVARSRICLGSSEGWASNSKPSRVRTKGNLAMPRPIWIRRSSRWRTSASQSRSSASRIERSRRPASSRRLSSRSRIDFRPRWVSLPGSWSGATLTRHPRRPARTRPAAAAARPARGGGRPLA